MSLAEVSMLQISGRLTYRLLENTVISETPRKQNPFGEMLQEQNSFQLALSLYSKLISRDPVIFVSEIPVLLQN